MSETVGKELGWLGPYRIRSVLGAGGMGVVYLAEDTQLQRQVAVKAMQPASAANNTDRQRFLREARAAAGLRHPNIVEIYQVAEHGGLPFLVMEYVAGGSLARKLRGGLLAPREAALLVETLARAIHHAHEQRIIHRDLKPGNILLVGREGAGAQGLQPPGLDAAQQPKITDFGLAKTLAGGAGPGAGVFGTPEYMAPEQARGRQNLIGPATDVWALGAILYECLTGRSPFQAGSTEEVLRLVTGADPVPPLRLRPGCPRDLEAVCLKCLEKESRKRYDSALDLADDLRRFLDQQPTPAAAPQDPAARRELLLDQVIAGEISRETYHRLLADLHRQETEPAAPAPAGPPDDPGDRPTRALRPGDLSGPVSVGNLPTRALGPGHLPPEGPVSVGNRPTTAGSPPAPPASPTGPAPARPRPGPKTVEQFLELVKKSGVVDQQRLETHVEKLRAARPLPDDPGALADLLVRDALLTQFQAEMLLQGKWRRFTVGKYQVLERLGSGGMGSVYLCKHTLMKRVVALKVLPAAWSQDPAALERFYREARAVAALDHPNIVRAYDIDQDDNLHFLVIEYVEGSTLHRITRHNGVLDVTRAAHYIRQAALGLQHAHEAAGLVHRDIKPGNLMVDRTGLVKILDLGLARFFNDEEDLIDKKYGESVLGTADFLAPEQALDSHGADIRADVYSLGGTSYFCLTGRPPFPEGTTAQLLVWHQTRQPEAIRALRPEVPEGLAAVVERMMAKEPGRRYQTPAEVAEALLPWTQTPILPPPEVEMPQLSPAAVAAIRAGSQA
jgi:serine/threonine protein kinase